MPEDSPFRPRPWALQGNYYPAMPIRVRVLKDMPRVCISEPIYVWVH